MCKMDAEVSWFSSSLIPQKATPFFSYEQCSSSCRYCRQLKYILSITTIISEITCQNLIMSVMLFTIRLMRIHTFCEAEKCHLSSHQFSPSIGRKKQLKRCYVITHRSLFCVCVDCVCVFVSFSLPTLKVEKVWRCRIGNILNQDPSQTQGELAK